MANFRYIIFIEVNSQRRKSRIFLRLFRPRVNALGVEGGGAGGGERPSRNTTKNERTPLPISGVLFLSGALSIKVTNAISFSEKSLSLSLSRLPNYASIEATRCITTGLLNTYVIAPRVSRLLFPCFPMSTKRHLTPATHLDRSTERMQNNGNAPLPDIPLSDLTFSGNCRRLDPRLVNRSTLTFLDTNQRTTVGNNFHRDRLKCLLAFALCIE